ncbi:putative two component response regulator [Acetobacter malorum DSM 14337]|uniref:Two component response regulator n=1 Tax=Acetobacter malorum DSM 14337 TaxID=1307910 RepID=A0ABQ0Q0D1_9PROT|nr:response regulator transcription factor [Acetobacter malorum]GBQ86029.1 putative two component response regulator [Acetobacter malorum DSM 14337]
MRVLCIGDSEKNLDGSPCKALSQAVREGGVSLQISGREGAIDTLRDYPFDLAVIQQTSPDPRIIKTIRGNRLNLSILVIVRSPIPANVAEILAAGADDCVCNIIEPVELLARMKAVVRRATGGGVASQTIVVGRMKVCDDAREVLIDGEPLSLTHTEFDILSMLAHKKSNLLSKASIASTLYVGKAPPQSKTIDVMVCRLRSKLREVDIQDPIKTHWGSGYSLVESAFHSLEAKALSDLSGQTKHSGSASISIPQTGRGQNDTPTPKLSLS